MGMSLEEQKKLLLPFLQRAEEVQKAEPKIAYYCRLYAVEQALQIPKEERLPEINGLLSALLAKLEKDRSSLQLSKDDGLYCENFALTVFNRADRVDRAGRADKNTALTFYAASYFMEILNQFGDLQPDVASRQKYSAWRAAEIRKALKEGRTPTPPPAANKQPEVSQEDQDLMDSLAPALSGGIISPSTSATLPTSQPPPPPFLQSTSADPSRLGSGTHQDFEGQEPSSPGGERLPSPPKRQLSRQISSRDSAAGAAWVAPPPRAFHQFQKVLYFTEGVTSPQLGTVAKIEAAVDGGTGTGPSYFVALKDRIVQADVTHLALQLSRGDRVAYYAPSGERLTASIEEIDTSHWPPSYLIHVDGGRFVETIDDRLEPLQTTQSPDIELEQLQLQQQLQQQAALESAGIPSHPPPAIAAVTEPPPAEPSAGPSHPPPAFLTSSSSRTGRSGSLPAEASTPAAAREGTPLYPPPPSETPAPTITPASSGITNSPQRLRANPPPGSPSAPLPAAAALPQPSPAYQPSLATVTEAQKQCKVAMSALSFEDVPEALKHLTEAVRMLSLPQHAVRPGGPRR